MYFIYNSNVVNAFRVAGHIEQFMSSEHVSKRPILSVRDHHKQRLLDKRQTTSDFSIFIAGLHSTYIKMILQLRNSSQACRVKIYQKQNIYVLENTPLSLKDNTSLAQGTVRGSLKAYYTKFTWITQGKRTTF